MVANHISSLFLFLSLALSLPLFPVLLVVVQFFHCSAPTPFSASFPFHSISFISVICGVPRMKGTEEVAATLSLSLSLSFCLSCVLCKSKLSIKLAFQLFGFLLLPLHAILFLAQSTQGGSSTQSLTSESSKTFSVKKKL